MTLVSIAKQYHQDVRKAKSLIRDAIDYGNSLEFTDSVYGITVHFMFRRECDYSLTIPWAYCESENKIRDYYERFKAHVEDERCLASYNEKADVFYEQEMKTLNAAEICVKS